MLAAMPWTFESSEHKFVVTQEVDGLNGAFDGAEPASKVSYSATLFVPEKVTLPPEMWAQDGYMVTSPTQQGLGYMLSYVAARRALAQDPKVTTIFVSSGSVEGGGQALIEKLGGVSNWDQVFELDEGGTVKVAGYLISTETMEIKAKEGFTGKGWVLISE